MFGVSSDEYLKYAQQNLDEWKVKGKQVVVDMARKASEEYDQMESSSRRNQIDDSSRRAEAYGGRRSIPGL